jgi:predicted TIM-barrel fold metal-dependent hydrolase
VELTMAERIFDAHFHIIDPQFPLKANQGFLPDPYTVDDYRSEVADLNVTGGAVVSGSFQAFDQTYLLDALERLGPGFVGVTQLPGEVSDEEVLRLDAAGVRAVRFNLRRGGSAEPGALESMAHRIHALAGWHVELYADAVVLADLVPLLVGLPLISIDHLGLTADGLTTLLKLVERGARVKATGFGRISGDVATMLRAVATVNPAAVLFGTDLPSTRTRRFTSEDMTLIEEALGIQASPAVFCDNAAEFYRVPSKAP